jgi:hypothetical protein
MEMMVNHEMFYSSFTISKVVQENQTTHCAVA